MMVEMLLAVALTQTAPVGSGLSDGLRLVYESAGVEQEPWVYESVRHIERDGFESCVIVTRQSDDPSESCSRGDTLFVRGPAGALVVARPIGPNMTLEVSVASGNTLHYTSAQMGYRSVGNGPDVQVIRTTIMTFDPEGNNIRRLREDYAPSLLTAVWGVFEEPDATGGWRILQEFALTSIRPPGGSELTRLAHHLSPVRRVAPTPPSRACRR